MESKGMRFDVVLGHSMGQYVAACAAGVFTAEDGMYVAIERGRAIEGTTADGTMAIVPADAATVRRLIGQTGVALDIAVVNSDRNTVVSGLTVDVERFAAAVRSAGVDVQPLGSLRAGHSRWMRPAADRLVRAFGQVRLSPPERMLICNTTGVVAADEVATPAYWARHLCEPVQFAAGLRRARDLGAGMFVELSGSAGMLSLASAVLDGHAGPWIPVLRPQQDAARSLANALAAAYEAGLDLDWAAVNGGYGRPTHLPTYPFQRRQYWTGPPAIWSGDASSPNDGSVAGAPIHEVRWRHIDLPDGSSLDRRFVVVGPDGPWRIQVSALLAGAAHTADPRDDAVRAADDVVVLFDDGDLDAGTDPVEALRPSITRLLDLVQGVVAAGAGSPPRLWLVTCGGQHTRPVDIVVPLQRALWGMGRVIALEHPELRVGLVDLPATATLADLDVLRSCLAASVPDRELAVRQGAAVSARLVPAEAGERTHVELRPDHTYLVIGGLTGVGLWTTQVLVEAGARHLLLIGRRPPGPIAEQRIAALREAGVSVEVASVDVGDAAAVDRLFAERRAEGPPIGGVVHSAGVLNDCLVGNADWSRVAPVLEAKVRGSWNLHQAAMRHDAPLSFFALYSSASAVHGNYGQAAYAAANAFLDGLAWLRSAQGLPGVSFNWGVFEGVGHVSTDTELMATLQQRGLGTVDAGVAKAVLLDHLSAATPEVMVLPNDWEAFLDVHNLRDASFYAELSAGTPGNPGPRKAASVRARLCAASAHERPDLLSRHIIGMINQYVELPTPISVDDRIADLGLDSLSTIQLRNDLQRALRTPLPARLLVTFPTVADLATHLLSSVLDLSAVTTEAVAIDGTVTETPPASAVEVVLSLEQRRWLRLIRRVGYGQRIVPVIFHDRLDRTAFRVALHTVLGRHDLLRQSYPNADSIVVLPVDEVMPADDDLFRDLSGTSTEVCAEAVASELGRLRAEIPDPVERPSWSVRCLALPADQFMLIVAGQHLEFDGSGLSVFVDEVRQVYREVRDTGAAPKLDPAFQYAEYARSQATYLAQGIDQARAHLTGIFTGVPRPTRLRRADDGDTTTAHPSVRYTPREPLAYWNEVRETAERLTVTPFAVILGSYAMLVNELVDAPTVCVSVIRSSRFDQRYASTIGPFTMPFPVPVHVQGWEGLELVRQVDDTLAALSLYPQYPATDLLTATRAFAGLPMDTYFSDVGINFTNYRRDEQVGSPRVDLVEVLGEVTHPLLRQYDFGALRRIPGLHLVVAVEGRELVGNYWYHAHRFTEMQVADWARRHRGLLSDLLAKASGWERSDAPIN
jgi:malonyl CoA-acyl carrier protein transacylase